MGDEEMGELMESVDGKMGRENEEYMDGESGE